MEKDIADATVKVKVKNLYGIFTSVIVTVVIIVTAWFNIQTKIDAAELKAEDSRSIALTTKSTISKRVERIECLLDELNGYLIYKKPPAGRCAPNSYGQ